jgi:hypothetical protein
MHQPWPLWDNDHGVYVDDDVDVEAESKWDPP